MLLQRIIRTFIPFLLLVLGGCGSPPASVASVVNGSWTNVQGEQAILHTVMGKVATVFVTLDPECPFCQFYAHDLQDLSVQFASQGVQVVGLYPGPFMERGEAAKFSAGAGFTFPQVMDDGCVLSLALKARVTPEFFITDADGIVVYAGALDDRAVRQGRKKYVAQKHYLADAIKGFLATGKPQAAVTAVGCIVECKN